MIWLYHFSFPKNKERIKEYFLKIKKRGRIILLPLLRIPYLH